MKARLQVIILFVVIAALMIVFNACNKDDDETLGPTISLVAEQGYISHDTVLAAGKEIKVKVNLSKGDLDITNFLINVITVDGAQTYFDTAVNTGSFSWTGSFIKSFSALEEWKFMVRDREGNAASTSITIGLDTSSVYLPLEFIQDIRLGAQYNATTEGCFNISDGSYAFFDDATADTSIQAGIDLLYYYSETDLNTIASPGANVEDGVFAVNPADWTIKNTTRFIKTGLSADDFMTAVNDSILLANYNESEAKRKAKTLDAGHIYTFRTQQGKLGMFMVNEVSGEAEGSVNIHLKIQK